jgi:hypothetical protein
MAAASPLAGSKPRALLALLFERDQAKRRRTMSRWLR